MAESQLNGYRLKVISGGQTGADKIALEVARDLGIPTGGTAPKDYKTENGPDLSLKQFGLREGGAGYKQRTMLNVDNADGTLAIRLHESSGTDYTIGYAQQKKWCFGQRGQTMEKGGYKPVLVIHTLAQEELKNNANLLCKFIVDNKIHTLNVAGHRETTSGIPDFKIRLQELLIAAFRQLGANTK